VVSIAPDGRQRSWIRKVEQGELRKGAERQSLPNLDFRRQGSSDFWGEIEENFKFSRVYVNV